MVSVRALWDVYFQDILNFSNSVLHRMPFFYANISPYAIHQFSKEDEENFDCVSEKSHTVVFK